MKINFRAQDFKIRLNKPVDPIEMWYLKDQIKALKKGGYFEFDGQEVKTDVFKNATNPEKALIFKKLANNLTYSGGKLDARRSARFTLRGLAEDGVSYLFNQKNMDKEVLDAAVKSELLNTFESKLI